MCVLVSSAQKAAQFANMVTQCAAEMETSRIHTLYCDPGAVAKRGVETIEQKALQIQGRHRPNVGNGLSSHTARIAERLVFVGG